MRKSFTFNGVRKTWLIADGRREKPPFAPVNRNTVYIPDRHFLRTSQKQPLVINQPVAFVAKSDSEALRLKDELAEWLVTDEPAALQFDDELGRTYFAVVQNTLEDFEKLATIRKGTIQFLCLDPYGYSDTIVQNLTNNPVIYNDGTAETFPVFEIDVLKDITNLEIRNKSITDRLGMNPAIVLGVPAQPDQELYVPEELVFHDTMQSPSSWQKASDIDNGFIAGEIAADNKGFYPEKFGDGIEPDKWQGPSLQKGLGTSVQDFRADIAIECLNGPEQMGTLTVYFRDANNNIVARIGFGDAWATMAENFGYMQLGNYYSGPRVDAHADYAYGWNNFNGIIRIARDGNEWTAYYAVVHPDGRHDWVHWTTRIVDYAGQYMAPIKTVQVAFRLWYGAQRADMHINNIKIFKLNKKPQTTAVPFMAQEGDRLIVDTKTSKILKNGELALELADLKTQMFPLAKRANRIEIVPNHAVNVRAKYRKAYL